MACPTILAVAAAAAPPTCASDQLQRLSSGPARPVPEEEPLDLLTSTSSLAPCLNGTVTVNISSAPNPASGEFLYSSASLSGLPQGMGKYVPGWPASYLATWQMLIAIALFPVSLQTLLQTDFPTLFPSGSNLMGPVTYCLLITVVTSFIFMLLCVMPEPYKRDLCVACVMHVCFGLAALAMGIALIVRLIGGHATAASK